MPVSHSVAYLSVGWNLPKNWEVATVTANMDDGIWVLVLVSHTWEERFKAVRKDQLLITGVLD